MVNIIQPNPNQPHLVVYGDIEHGHKFYGPFANLDKAIEFQNKNFPDDWCGTNAFPLFQDLQKEKKDNE